MIDIINGDCLAVMPTLPAQSIDAIITDLPYGTTRNKWDSILPLDQLWSAWRRICKPGAPVILFSQQPFTTTLAASNLKQLRTEWIWQKHQGTGFLNANRYPMKSHEQILVFCDRKPPYFPQFSLGKPYTTGKNNGSTNYGYFKETQTVNTGTRYPTSILRFAGDRPTQHPTQKPVALIEYLIRTYTSPGQTILDCTAGSGTTAVAALNTDRDCIAIELDPSYCDIARKRVDEARDAYHQIPFPLIAQDAIEIRATM